MVALLAEEKYYKALLKGAADEDDPTLTRGLNWHFYPANETLTRANRDFIIFTLRPTSLHIIGKRQEEAGINQLSSNLVPSYLNSKPSHAPS